MPWEGHLEACYSICAYLHKHPTMSSVFHPSRINIRQDCFKSQDWTDFYGDGVEKLLPDIPESLGEAVKVAAFVDSDHAGICSLDDCRLGIYCFAIKCESPGIARNKSQWRHQHSVQSLLLHICALKRLSLSILNSECLGSLCLDQQCSLQQQ